MADYYSFRSLTLRLLGKADCPALPSESDLPLEIGSRVAIIDLRVFVPEVVSVLSTLARDSFGMQLKLIPFVDSLIGRGAAALPPIPHDQGAIVRFLIEDAVVNSNILVLKDLPVNIRMDAAARISNLNIVKSLYGTQLESFLKSLKNAVHCTHGPPGSGKSFLGVALVLALMELRNVASSSGVHNLGPILMISYKNHALDEFLVDVLKWTQHAIRPGMMIRTGKPEHAKLQNYSERSNRQQYEAEEELSERISILRESRKFNKDLRDIARHLEVHETTELTRLS